ncbi:MAG TPA: ATP-binding protein [Chlamydiales bacterium]|nr:ATP-binding protein [Chlamydiales bacterium]
MIRNNIFKQKINNYIPNFLNHSYFIPKFAFGISAFSSATLLGNWAWSRRQIPENQTPEIEACYSRTEQGKLEVNTPALIQSMGVSMYASSVAQVAMKELLQNAFDAVKEAVHKGLIHEGDIQISINPSDRSITIKDNGIGMTPEIVKSAFFTLGGTHKDIPPQLRSGGYGQAKIAFMLGVEKISLSTTRDGITTEVVTTPPQLLESTFTISISEQPRSKPGTTVQIWIPEKTGERVINFEMPYFHYSALNAPLIGPTKVSVTDNAYVNEELKSGVNFDTPFILDYKFDWGTASIYSDFSGRETYYPEISILSSGIFQFSEFVKDKDRECIPYDVIIDIKPNVLPSNPLYPFTNNRGSFRGSVKEDFEKLKSAIKWRVGINRKAELEKTFSKLFCIEDGQWKPLLKDLHQYQAEEIKFAEKSFFDDVLRILRLPREKPKPSKFIQCNGPIFWNHEERDVSAETKREAEEFFTEIGKVPLLMRNAMASHSTDYRQIANPDYFTGIGISNKFRGAHTLKEPKAILMNPISSDAKSIDGICRNMIDTMIHELAHTTVIEHGERHNSEMIRVRDYLADQGILTKAEEQIKAVLTKHQNVYWSLKKQFPKNTSTENCSL